MRRTGITVSTILFLFVLLPSPDPATAGDVVFTEIAKRTASDVGIGWVVGESASIDGDTMVVGAGGADGALPDTGAAYVFVRNQGGADGWQEVAKLVAGDAASLDRFGTSVAISGDLIVVGASQADPVHDRAGAAYVFGRNTGGPDAWGQITKLTASDPAVMDEFGDSVAVDGDIIVVGATGADVSSSDNGAIYVFERNSGGVDNWGQTAKIDGPASSYSYMGDPVVIDGDTIVGGAPNRNYAYVYQRNLGGADNWGLVQTLTGSSISGHRFAEALSIAGDTIAAGGASPSQPGAAWVFERNHGGADNWGELVRITASDGAVRDRFGQAVALSHDRLLVGAKENDFAGTDSGSAYVFERNAGGIDNWGETQQLFPSDPTDYKRFGSIVAMDGPTAVVSGPSDGPAYSYGAVYLFESCGTASGDWSELGAVVSSDASHYDHLGYSTALDGDTMIVGAPNKNFEGAAYIFHRNTGGPDAWGEVVKLVSSDHAQADRFGDSVAVSGDIAVVGAPEKKEAQSNTGAVYVFGRNHGGPDNWGQITKLAASDIGYESYFGVDVAISGDTIVAGARGDSSIGHYNGAAYVFARNQGGADNWGQVTKILGSDTSADDNFGWAVDISGDTIIIGSKYNRISGHESGSAYIFERNQGGADNWGEVAIIAAADLQNWVEFATSVAIDVDTVVVGADDDDVGGSSRGSAYVFERNQGGADNWGQVAKITASNPVDYAFFGSAVAIDGDVAIIGADAGGSGLRGGHFYAFDRNLGGPDNWGEAQWFISPDTVTNDSFAWSLDISGGIVAVSDFMNDHSGLNSPGKGFLYLMGCPEFDFGDAPDPSFPTLTASNGARHKLGGAVFLGSIVDTDLDGQPTEGADGDDNDAEGDDEDGVTILDPIINGETTGLEVTVSNACVLSAWIDFENDGDWDDPGEQIFTDEALVTGTNTLSFPVPSDAAAGEEVVARFRVSTAGGLDYTGSAPDGEVEDYEFSIEDIDYGDAPDPTYPTLLASNGARHIIGGPLFLGSLVDAEWDGIPAADASGDDTDGLDDEDGVDFGGPMVIGTLANVDVIASAPGLLNAWVDFNADGDWLDSGEQIFTDVSLSAGSNPLGLAIPPTAVAGDLMARFRIDSAGGLSPTGLAVDGEVEDHTVTAVEIDYGDAPDPMYPTLDASDGARHIIADGLFLGAAVDHEADGQPTAGADGDDLDGSDDEDGVVFTTGLGRGLTASVDVTASGTGLLSAWIDFNADGDWDDAGEQVFTDQALASGVNPLSFPVPPAATLGSSYARFRFSTNPGLAPNGPATDGEVEDFAVEIVEGPDLEIEMTASSDPAPSGRPLTYTITVTNNGPLPATSVTVTDPFPGELIFVSSSPGAPDCTYTTGTLTCDLGSLAPSATSQVTIETVLDHPVHGAFSNSSTVTANELDPITANNTTAVDTTIALFVDGFESGNLTGWD